MCAHGYIPSLRPLARGRVDVYPVGSILGSAARGIYVAQPRVGTDPARKECIFNALMGHIKDPVIFSTCLRRVVDVQGGIGQANIRNGAIDHFQLYIYWQPGYFPVVILRIAYFAD